MPRSKRKIQPDDYYRVRTVSDPQVSPDGKQVAYVVSWPDRELDETQMAIFVAPMDGRTPARQFTHGRKDYSPRWSPDGKTLAFVSDRGEKGQIYAAPVDGGEPRQVTKARFGVSQPAWSPDGKRMAYASRTGRWKEREKMSPAEKNAPRVLRNLRYKLDGIGFFDDRRLHIFTVDVESGMEKRITTGDWYDDQPSWSPDGRRIAFVSDRERARHQRQWRTDVWVVPSNGGRARKVTRSRGSASQPAWSPDGRRIAYVGHENGDEGGAKNIHLMVVPTSGAGGPRSVSESLDRPVAGWPAFGSGRTFCWSGSDSLVFLAGDRGTQGLHRVSLESGAMEKKLGGERQIEAFTPGPDAKMVAFSAVWPGTLPDLYVATLGSRSRERNLSRANDAVSSEIELAVPGRLECAGPGGFEVESFVIYPRGYTMGRRYPLAVNVHGGPHSVHPGGSWLEYQLLAAAGYVVLLPNPRGSTTYGEGFSEACVRDWAGGDFGDIMASVDELIARGVADPGRLYIGGYSYGGYMSAWAVGNTRRFRAAVVGAPVSNNVSMFGTGDIPLFDLHEIGGLPQENMGEYVQRSPVTHLANATTPVLLLHHEGDLRCPIAQSEEIFHALKLLGKKVEFVRYPGGFHTYNTHPPSQMVDRTRRTVAWYEKHG